MAIYIAIPVVDKYLGIGVVSIVQGQQSSVFPDTSFCISYDGWSCWKLYPTTSRWPNLSHPRVTAQLVTIKQLWPRIILCKRFWNPRSCKCSWLIKTWGMKTTEQNSASQSLSLMAGRRRWPRTYWRNSTWVVMFIRMNMCIVSTWQLFWALAVTLLSRDMQTTYSPAQYWETGAVA